MNFRAEAGSPERVARRRAPFRWSIVLWALIYPRRAHRVVPTVPGVVLVALSFGIGTAAYNSSSNILFLTLSLLLTCLILSGVLSWLNLRGITWRLHVPPALRAGHDAVAMLELRNGKKFLPTYGLWFNLAAQPHLAAAHQRAESTVTARGADIRAALAQADAAEVRGRVALAGRLDPRGTAQLDWVFRPVKRGPLRIQLVTIGSLFPFGFLRKDVGVALEREVIVWPAPVEYRRHALTVARRVSGGERVPRAGAGSDLLAVRRYASGDSHRLIHWKASARTRQLLVRQFAAESAEGYGLWLETDTGLWPRADQFETAVSFAATLAEDLFRAGRLLHVSLGDAAPTPVRRMHELERFLDVLAVAQSLPQSAAPRALPARHNVLTFAPDGPRGVAAYLDGQLTATA